MLCTCFELIPVKGLVPQYTWLLCLFFFFFPSIGAATGRKKAVGWIVVNSQLQNMMFFILHDDRLSPADCRLKMPFG